MRYASASARLGAAVLAGLLASSCSNPSPSSEAATSNDKTIKIGIDLALSGADATDGIPTRNGAVLAIETANARRVPGGYRFVAYDLDDAVQGAHDPAQGAQNTKTFVADDAVLAMIGPFNSSVAQAEIPITNDAGLAQISPATTNPGLTMGPAGVRLRASHPDTIAFFRVSSTDDRQGLADARAARTLHLKKAFVVDDNETYGKGLADVFARAFADLGGTVVGREHLTKGQTDFKALLTKARALDPDFIFYGGTTATGGGLLRKQMGDTGMSSLPFVGGDGISDDAFLTTAGSMASGTYYTVAGLAGAKDFLSAYKHRFGSDVGAYSANGYAAASLVIAAIEKAIRDGNGAFPSRADVRKNVAATKNFATPIGVVGFDADGDTTNPALSLYRIAGGRSSLVSVISFHPH